MARAAAVEDGLLAPSAVLVPQKGADPAETASMIRRAGARTIHNLASAGPLAGDARPMLDILMANENEA